MTTPTFENAKADYKKQKAKYLTTFEKIPNEDSLPDDSRKKIAKAKQLYAFVAEQERYFGVFVEKRDDAVEYVQSVSDVLALATEILADLEEPKSEEKRMKKLQQAEAFLERWTITIRSLLNYRITPQESRIILNSL